MARGDFQDAVHREMIKTEQTKGQSVHQHCQSVWEHYEDLLNYIKYLSLLQKKWRLPSWLDKIHADMLHPTFFATSYTLYHDCGKPFCKVVDKDGSIHFPDHAACSKYVWACLGLDGRPSGSTCNEIVGNLIGWNMVLYTANAEEIKRYCEEEWDSKDAFTLLFVSLAEIHSNARLFGGIESVSFKSKWKKLDRRGKQICKFYEGKNDE